MGTLLDTLLETRRIIYPRAANDLGTAHGGNLLMWIEQISSWSAMRHCGTTPMTVGVENARFHRPVPEGEIAFLVAYVFEAGTSSVKTRVRCYHEDKYSGDRELAVEATLVHVGVDEADEPTTVPDLTVETDEGERFLAEALGEA